MRAAAAIAILGVLSVAGCAQPHHAPTEPQGGTIERSLAPKGPLPAFAHDGDADPGRRPSTERWEASYSRKFNHRIASIMSRSNDQLIQLVCDPDHFFIQIVPRQQLGSPVASRRIALAFDGGPLQEQPWEAKEYSKTDWDFGGGSGKPGFRQVIEDLKEHRELTTVISSSGKETIRRHFTLQGSAKAIDFVLQTCGVVD